jgi:hypothetical protein
VEALLALWIILEAEVMALISINFICGKIRKGGRKKRKREGKRK